MGYQIGLPADVESKKKNVANLINTNEVANLFTTGMGVSHPKDQSPGKSIPKLGLNNRKS